MNKPQIVFFLLPFRKLAPNKLEHRRQLINSFVNAIILYEDRFTFVGNDKDGTKTVTFAELEAADLGSGFTASCVSKKRIPKWVSAFLRPPGGKGSYLFFLCICRIAIFVVY